LHPCSRRWRGNRIEEALPGFEPGIKVLQTAGRPDINIYNTTSSSLVRDRLSLNVPFEGEIPPDLAAVIKARDQLPAATKAGIVACVVMGSGLGAYTME
jgi:hypothetical protein